MTRITAATLRAAGWRQHGAQWYPPWPDSFAYTFGAAKLAQELATKRNKRKGKTLEVRT